MATMSSSSSSSLKDLKEAFVTGYDGTSRSELLLVCLSSPLGIFVYLELQQWFQKRLKHSFYQSWAFLTILEAFTILLPMAMCQTNLLYPWGVVYLSVELILVFSLKIISYLFRTTNNSTTTLITPSKPSSPSISSLPFLTSYRSTVSYLTFVAILAVDFHVFPRRFAKTETYGFGLMDLGAGSFVVSAGFVSPYARRHLRGMDLSNEDLNKIIYRSIPLLILGGIRLVTNKSLEYQEHVSEYGIHWNFFFTLCMVHILTSMFRIWMDRMHNRIGFNLQFWIPIWILVIYQCSLSLWDVQQYIEDAPRQCQEYIDNNSNDSGGIAGYPWYNSMCNIMAGNREGILGCLGYMAIYCISEEIASFCLWDPSLSVLISRNESFDSDSETTTVNAKKDDSSVVDPHKNVNTHESLRKRKNTTQSTISSKQHQQPTSTSASAQSNSNTMTHHRRHHVLLGKRLGMIFFLFAFLDYVVSEIFNIQTSRRSTNVAFVVWALEFNVGILLLIWCAFYISQPPVTPSIAPSASPTFAAVNRNGLVIFLIANLLTGAVNLSINTLLVSDMGALGAIFGYLCCVGGIALCLDKVCNVTLKL